MATILDIEINRGWYTCIFLLTATLWSIVITEQFDVGNVVSPSKVTPIVVGVVAIVAFFVHLATGKCRHAVSGFTIWNLATSIWLTCDSWCRGFTPVFSCGLLLSFISRPVDASEPRVVRGFLFIWAAVAVLGSWLIIDPPTTVTAGGYKLFNGAKFDKNELVLGMITGLMWGLLGAQWKVKTNPVYALHVASVTAFVLSLVSSFVATMVINPRGELNMLNFQQTAWLIVLSLVLYSVFLAITLFMAVQLSFDMFMCLCIASMSILPCQHLSSMAPAVTPTQIAGGVRLLLVALCYHVVASRSVAIKKHFGKSFWKCQKCARMQTELENVYPGVQRVRGPRRETPEPSSNSDDASGQDPVAIIVEADAI